MRVSEGEKMYFAIMVHSLKSRGKFDKVSTVSMRGKGCVFIYLIIFCFILEGVGSDYSLICNMN